MTSAVLDSVLQHRDFFYRRLCLVLLSISFSARRDDFQAALLRLCRLVGQVENLRAGWQPAPSGRAPSFKGG